MSDPDQRINNQLDNQSNEPINKVEKSILAKKYLIQKMQEMHLSNGMK